MSIQIRRTKNADTRIAEEVPTKELLLKESKEHIQHVNDGVEFLSEKMSEQAKKHDHTKIQFIDEFYDAFLSSKKGEDFKSKEWWQYHLEERHHLNDRVPIDVNLIDVLEMIVDSCVAGMARSGEVYELSIPTDVLSAAVQNTKKLILANIDVVE